MITVEDYNSFLQKYGIKSHYHKIDTNLVGDYDFEDVMIDFCTVTRTTSGNNHTYSFTVDNPAWTLGYYLLDSDNEVIASDATLTDDTVSFTTTEPSITLVLHCCNIQQVVPTFTRLTDIMISDNVTYQSSMPSRYTFQNISTGSTSTKSPNTTGDIGEFTDGVHCCVNFRPLTKLNFDLSNVELYAGQVNEISKPSSTGLITLTYLDKEETFDLADVDVLTIDLTNQYNISSVRVNVHIHGTGKYYESIDTYNVSIVPVKAYSFAELQLAISNKNAVIDYYGSESFTEDLVITTDTLIRKRENGGLYLEHHSIIVEDGVTLKLQGLPINKGNPAILQKEHSIVELNDCFIYDCSNEDNANLGSVICCDLDTDSLNYTDDYTTTIINCTFENNYNCILHGGQLTVIGCTYTNFDPFMVDVNNPAFLFQVDGNAVVTDSSFSINYDDEFVFEDKNIMYAQALFMIGLTAVVNNATYSDLNQDDKVNWHNSPYNNRSSLNCIYFYPSYGSHGALVRSSATSGNENRAMCYALSGVDWVFKENVKITLVG